MSTLNLEIVTPEKVVLEEKDVDFVGVEFLEKDENGKNEIGILPDHAPMLVRLSVAPIRYKNGENTSYAVVAGGFLEVKDNKIMIISAGAELVKKEPDVEPAITARKRVEAWLKDGVGKVGFDEKMAEADIKKSAINLYKHTT